MGFQVWTVGNQSRAGIGVDADHLVRGPSKSVRKTREDGRGALRARVPYRSWLLTGGKWDYLAKRSWAFPP
jgi:hypothetical protein